MFCKDNTNLICCQFCGEDFTENEFIEREGAETFKEMASCGGYVMCPDCYEKTEPKGSTCQQFTAKVTNL